MLTTDTSLNRGRRGTSTVLGTLIFVGILFTAVIPMFLVIRQADTLFENSKHELGILDQERRDEALYVYIYTVADPRSLIVKVQNKGELSVRIVRLWVNDEPLDLDYIVPPMSDIEEIHTYPIPEETDSYYIKVTTDRGNSVAFDTPLVWDYGMGWTSEILSINVLITSLPGNIFKIEVTGPDPAYQETLTLKYEPKFFLVDVEGTYAVTIFRGTKEIYYEEVTINDPEGPLVAWVFA